MSETMQFFTKVLPALGGISQIRFVVVISQFAQMFKKYKYFSRVLKRGFRKVIKIRESFNF